MCVQIQQPNQTNFSLILFFLLHSICFFVEVHVYMKIKFPGVLKSLQKVPVAYYLSNQAMS